MLVMVNGAVPWLVTVTGCAPLVVFTAELNASVVGVAESAGAVPVPLSATETCGVPRSDVLMTSDAVRAPTAEGAKRTRTVQLRPELMVAPHWLFSKKSARLVPLSTMLLRVSALGPELLMFTVHD